MTKKLKNFLSLAAFVVGLSSTAFATPFVYTFVGPNPGGFESMDEPLGPTFTIEVNGMDIADFDSNVSILGEGYAFSGSGKFVNPTDATDFLQFSFSGVSDADPFINWAFGATAGTKSASAFMKFSQPTVGTYNTAIAGFNGSLGLVVKGPLAATNITSDNMINGTSIITLPPLPGTCDYGVQSPAINRPCPIGGGQFGPKTVSFGPLTNPLMESTIAFDVTPNSSGTFQGQFILDSSAVPEPSTVTLLGAGLIALAAFGRKLVRK